MYLILLLLLLLIYIISIGIAPTIPKEHVLLPIFSE